MAQKPFRMGRGPMKERRLVICASAGCQASDKITYRLRPLMPTEKTFKQSSSPHSPSLVVSALHPAISEGETKLKLWLCCKLLFYYKYLVFLLSDSIHHTTMTWGPPAHEISVFPPEVSTMSSRTPTIAEQWILAGRHEGRWTPDAPVLIPRGTQLMSSIWLTNDCSPLK